MWVNIQSLCELGADLDVEKHFEEAFFKRAAAGATAADSTATTAAAAATPAAPARGGYSRFRLPGTETAASGRGGGRPKAQQKASQPPVPPTPPPGIWAGSGDGGRRPPWAPYMAFGRGLTERCPGLRESHGGEGIVAVGCVSAEGAVCPLSRF